MKISSAASKRMTRRAHADRVAERAFVRVVLARKVTPEGDPLSPPAAQPPQPAMNAPFLARFRKSEASVA